MLSGIFWGDSGWSKNSKIIITNVFGIKRGGGNAKVEFLPYTCTNFEIKIIFWALFNKCSFRPANMRKYE